MTDRVLRGAIIGLGNVAANGHLPGWLGRSDVMIAAAADAVPARRSSLRGAAAGAAWYANAEDLLAREKPDFVDIATPPASHAALIRLALESGAHVLCEKPLVTRAEDVDPIADLAHRRRLAVHTVHNWLKAPGVAAAASAVSEGAIGPVRRVEWTTLRTKPAVTVTAEGETNWRTDAAIAGGGILVDHGWHALYCVGRLMGVTPATVAARLECRGAAKGLLEDTATVTLAAPGVEGRIFLTWAAAKRENRLDVLGRDGRLTLEGGQLTLERSGQPTAIRPCPPPLEDGSHHPDWFGGVVEDFMSAMRDPRPDRAANLGEAGLCARLIADAKRSHAAGGAPVPLEGGRTPTRARRGGNE